MHSPTPIRIYPYSPTPRQEKSYLPTPSPKMATPTHTQPKKVTPTHTHWHPAKKRLLTDTHPHPAEKRSPTPTPTRSKPKKAHTHPTLAVNLWKRKFFIIHSIIKFIRNSRSPKNNFPQVQCQTIGISIQYWTIMTS